MRCSMREPDRSGSGSWAMSSSGRWKLNSETCTYQDYKLGAALRTQRFGNRLHDAAREGLHLVL